MGRFLAALLALSISASAAWAAERGHGNTVGSGQLSGGTLSGPISPTVGSTFIIVGVNADGSLKIQEASPDRDKVLSLRDWFTSASIAAGAGDSSGVEDVHAYRYLKTLWKVTPIGAAVNTTVRLGVSFRECLDGAVDSTSAFNEYQYGVFPVGSITASSRSDTTIAGHLITPTVPATEAWSGEYVLTFNMNRSAPGSGAAALVWSYPNGLSIPLDSFFARAARFNMLQMRVRNLNLTGPAVKVSVSLLGFAQ